MVKLFLFFVFFFVAVSMAYIIHCSSRPFTIVMPVRGAQRNSYSQNSFGAPRQGHTHKGVDIFAKKGTDVLSATQGLVIFTGNLSLGGKVITILSPEFKFLYYAHLDTVITTKFSWVSPGDLIGKVGNTGNAINTPPHLHFSVSKIIPKKTFINPAPLLNTSFGY